MKNTLKIERNLKEITQQQLASLTGVSRQTINSIETNKYIPNTLLALKISRILQKKVDELFFLEEYD